MKHLMLEKPFEKIRIQEICDCADLSRRTFYRYFKDKYDLLDWIYEDDYLQYMHPEEGWHEWDYLPRVCRFFYKEREFYRRAFAVTGEKSFRNFCFDRMLPIMKQDFSDQLSEEEEAVFFPIVAAALQDNMIQWMAAEPCMPPDEYAAKVQSAVKRFSTRMGEIIS